MNYLMNHLFLEQEMMVVAEKQEIRNFYKIFLFFSSIPKVKNYCEFILLKLIT